MPGQAIIAGTFDSEKIRSDLGNYCFDERYVSSVDKISDTLSIGWTQYPGYPIKEYNIDGTTVYVEGCIYHHPYETTEQLLKQIVEAQITERPSRLKELLFKSDGEYLITIISDEDTVTVITDPLGRLPLGIYNDQKTAIVARHKLLIADLVDTIGIDRLDAACYLHWGFAIGGRSLLKDVQRVPPSSIVIVHKREITVDRYHEWRVDSERYANRSIEENAAEMARLFREGCWRRDARGPGETIALLSGGLDSRAILGALADSETFSATTRNQPNLDAQQDITIAEELADVMDVEWTEYSIGMPTGDHIETHMQMKGGLDPISTTHELLHLSQLIDEHPASTIMSGSGGDKLLPDLRPAVSIESDADAVDYIMKSASRLPIDVVSEVTGVSEAKVREYISSVVASYPEDTAQQKVIHFKYFERMYAWLYEAGDMNRCHLWNTSPFYTIEFFDYALGVPDDQKAGHKLFAAWLKNLDERLVDVPNANTRTTVGSLPHRIQLKAYHFLTAHPEVFELIKPTAKALLQGDDSDEVISYPIDSPEATGTINGANIDAHLFDESLSRGSRCQLLTLAYIEQLLSEKQAAGREDTQTTPSVD